jgi:hypothetical protein
VSWQSAKLPSLLIVFCVLLNGHLEYCLVLYSVQLLYSEAFTYEFLDQF